MRSATTGINCETYQITNMITKAELSGIIDALGAVTPDEIQEIAEELAFMRQEEAPDTKEIKQLCETAAGEHLIETVSSNEVRDADMDEADKADDACYYIPGPNAFPQIPSELSEVIDILKLSKREVDMGRVAKSFSARLKRRATSLNNKIDSFAATPPTPDDIAKLEKRYRDLLNVYYDYDFWLPGELSHIEDVIFGVSEKLERVKAAADS